MRSCEGVRRRSSAADPEFRGLFGGSASSLARRSPARSWLKMIAKESSKAQYYAAKLQRLWQRVEDNADAASAHEAVATSSSVGSRRLPV
jgi:hypothetical protein